MEDLLIKKSGTASNRVIFVQVAVQILGISHWVQRARRKAVGMPLFGALEVNDDLFNELIGDIERLLEFREGEAGRRMGLLIPCRSPP